MFLWVINKTVLSQSHLSTKNGIDQATGLHTCKSVSQNSSEQWQGTSPLCLSSGSYVTARRAQVFLYMLYKSLTPSHLIRSEFSMMWAAEPLWEVFSHFIMTGCWILWHSGSFVVNLKICALKNFTTSGRFPLNLKSALCNICGINAYMVINTNSNTCTCIKQLEYSWIISPPFTIHGYVLGGIHFKRNMNVTHYPATNTLCHIPVGKLSVTHSHFLP